MSLTGAANIASAFSFLVALLIVIWYVVPWSRTRSAATALTALLWVHVPRYVALQIFSARHFGFAIPLSMAREIAWGDVAGASLALLAIIALRYRWNAARIVL